MAINFGHISGAEPSTVTFKAATITQTINSSAMHKEVIVLGDPQSSIGIAVVKAAAPVSTEFGLVVRIAGGPSSAVDCAIRAVLSATSADNPVLISGNSTAVISAFAAALISSAVQAGGSSALNVRNVWSSTHADQPVQASILNGNSSVIIHGDSTVIQGTDPWLVAITGPMSSAAPAAGDSGVIVRVVGYSTIVTVAALPANSSQVEVRNAVALSAAQSSVLPSSGSSGLVVRQVWDDRLTAKSSNAFSSTSFSVASSVAGVRAYVTAYTITSTVAAATKIAFYDGSTMIWPIQLQAVSSGVSGANLSAYPYLFHGDQSRALTLQTPSSVAGIRVGVSYFLAP